MSELIEAVYEHIISLPSPILVAMGATDTHDYTGEGTEFKDRLTRCYELAAKAFYDRGSQPNAMPEPRLLIHGRWSSPASRHAPIDHAWVMLADERVWEPISMTLCDPDMFYEYTQGVQHRLYSKTEALQRMLRYQHFGPWPC